MADTSTSSIKDDTTARSMGPTSGSDVGPQQQRPLPAVDNPTPANIDPEKASTTEPVEQRRSGDKPLVSPTRPQTASASHSLSAHERQGTTSDDSNSDKKSQLNTLIQACGNVIFYVPKRCRWDPEEPPKFHLGLNFLFAVASTVTVANLYYNHPILNVLAHDFNVTYEKSSVIPTVMQAGYASGLLFICPLGDVLRRRTFVLSLCFFTATVWLGLCLTQDFTTFAVLSYIVAVTTVTPQLMLPLVGDLAPPARRATALSIVVSGLLLGMLVARFLSGVVTNYTSWRNIYWLALGMQYGIVTLLWFFLPDYPITNPDGINYFKMLWSIVSFLLHEPVLVQACIVGFCTGSIFTSFWTTLTFLLSSPPYEYNSLVIGLFAFIGIAAMTLGPVYSRYVIDRFVPIFTVIIGQLMCMTGVVIGTFVGTFNVAGPVIQAFAIDLGIQTSQIANRSAIYGIAPKARNRVNTAYMVSVFSGQLTGTAVGNRLYALGGWKASGCASIGFIGVSLIACLARSPWNKGWIGWKGGWSIKRRDLGPRHEEPAIEQALEELSSESTPNEVGQSKAPIDGVIRGEAEKNAENKTHQ